MGREIAADRADSVRLSPRAILALRRRSLCPGGDPLEYRLEHVGQRLREARKRSGMTQEALGEACGLHPSYIGQIERGERQPALATLAAIGRALGTPLDLLVKDAPDDAPDQRESVRSEIDLLLGRATQQQLHLVLRIVKAVIEPSGSPSRSPEIKKRRRLAPAGKRRGSAGRSGPTRSEP